MIGSMQDITKIKTLQYNLERAIEDRDNSLEKINDIKIFYERILKNSPTQILVFDKNLRLSFSNTHENASSSIWNIPENTQLKDGEPNINLNKIHGFINDAIIQKKLVQIEDTFENYKQEVHYLRTILPYFNNNREIENIFVIGIDITELKRFENDIIQKNNELQKINLELDHFVYSISHDLRSPLLSIKGIIGLVLKSNTISEENKKFLEMTMSSATRLDNTIQEILDYSRNSRLEVSNTSFDIKELIEIVFEDLRFSANTFTEIEFNVTCATTIFSDKPRLGVLLKNVIGNCIKYRKPDVASKITVGINEINNALQIEIKDNGEGIPPKHVEKVFDMFYRASTTSVGTGLGLYICKEIASKLGGQILLESELGVGTTVTIILQNYKS
jgi:signal transduction histidine kinase